MVKVSGGFWLWLKKTDCQLETGNEQRSIVAQLYVLLPYPSTPTSYTCGLCRSIDQTKVTLLFRFFECTFNITRETTESGDLVEELVIKILHTVI